MMDLRNREHAATNALSIVAVLLLAGLLIVMLTVSKPTPQSVDRKYRTKEFELKIAQQDAEKKLKAVQTEVAQQTWNVPEQQVHGMALARVTDMAKKRGLKVVSFRPQRTNQTGGLIQLPYLLTIDGSYMAALNLCKDLEQPATRLAVSQLQVASADSATDRVTASIGVVAFMRAPKSEEPTPAANRRSTRG